jgi:hypothetical protein
MHATPAAAFGERFKNRVQFFAVAQKPTHGTASTSTVLMRIKKK